MTFPALAFDAVSGSPSYSAQQFRLALSGVFVPNGALAARTGALSLTSWSPSISSGVVSIAPGRAIVQGATTTTQGAYLCVMPTTWTYTIPAANATYSRIDLVYLRVWDNEVDSSGETQADLVYLSGTAAASPVAPTIPAGQTGMQLCTITVPKSGGGSPSYTIVMPFTATNGGIALALTAADEATFTALGQVVLRNDTGRFEWYNGASWQSITERHYCTATTGTGWSISSNTYSSPNFTSAAQTDSSMWSSSTPNVITLPTAGTWRATIQTEWPGGTSNIHCGIYYNGNIVQAGFMSSSGGGQGLVAVIPLSGCAVGDQIKPMVYATGGVSNSAYPIVLQVDWLGPA